MDISSYMLLSKNDALVREAEVTTNNIANSNTKGYKQRNLYFRNLINDNGSKTLRGTNAYPYDSYIQYDSTNGAIVSTLNKLDFMFDKPDYYFGVNTPQGTRYSRNGEFHINQDNRLVDHSGNEVLSADGNIIVIEGNDFEIDSKGEVYVNDLPLTRLGLFHDDKKNIKKASGKGLYSFDVLDDEGKIIKDKLLPTDNKIHILRGFIEDSNVSAIDQMTNLVKTQKSIDQINALYNEVANKMTKDLMSKLSDGN